MNTKIISIIVYGLGGWDHTGCERQEINDCMSSNMLDEFAEAGQESGASCFSVS